MGAPAGIKTSQDIVKFEKKQQKKTLSQLPNSTYELLQTSAKKYGGKPAVSMMLQASAPFKLQTFSYKQLFQKVNQTANFFHSLGASKDSVIGLIMPNLAQTHFAIWGGEATGIVMPVNPLLEPDAIANLLAEANVSILVTLAPFPKVDLWQKVAQVLPNVPSLQHVMTVNLAHQVGGIKGKIAGLLQKKHVRGLYGKKGIQSVIPQGVQLHDFTASIKKQNAKSLDSKRVFDQNDHSSYFCTGGTTGLPKIAMRCHRNELANVEQIRAMFGEQTITSKKTVLTGLPLFHVNAVLATGLYPFKQGAHVILATPQGFRGEGVIPDFWRIVAKHKVNFFAAVPTVYSALMNYPTKGHNISSLEYGICGAAPMPVQVFKDFEAMSGIKILEGYGLTEGACVSSVNPPLGERKIGSIGMRLPMQQMKVIALSDDGTQGFTECPVNEKGIIAISGDNAFQGYKIEAQNNGIWLKDTEGNTWLNTGDLGYQDEDGYFYLTGRKKEMIIRGGHNIDPKSIEEVMYTHDAVAFAAAIGKPDAYAGELPVLYVELKPEATVTEADIMTFAADNIPERAAVPKAVHIIEAMPLTAVGKVYKPELKKQSIIESFGTALTDAKIDADITVDTHPVYGLDTKVTVKNTAQKAEAAKILGAFAVRHEVV